MAITQNSSLALTSGDLKSLDKILYTPRKQELTARKIFTSMSGLSPTADTIAYKVLKESGKAKIGRGFKANDIPVVGSGDGYEVSNQVFTIASMISISQDELMKISEMRKNSGVGYDLLSFKIQEARRIILESENNLIFNGDTKYNIKGLLNTTGITKESVQDSKVATTTKKKWSSKTSQEIQEDIRLGFQKASQNGLYNPDTLVLPTAHYQELMKPFSEHTPLTTLSWLEGNSIDRRIHIYRSNELLSSNNVLKKDCFVIFESSPQIAQIGLSQDFQLTNPVFDPLGDYSFVATVRNAGLIVRYPKAIYIGTDI